MHKQSDSAAARARLRADVAAKLPANALVRRERGDGPAPERDCVTQTACKVLAARERLASGGNLVRRTAGIAFGPHPRQRLDIYARIDACDAPVVVFFYGGAWNSGDKVDFEFVGVALARRGYVVVIGDQRLAPHARFPDFVEDAAATVAWSVRECGHYGGRTHRVLLMGHSAGAYNAVMLALDRRFLDRHGVHGAVAGAIGLSGPYDFHPFPLQLCEDAFGSADDPRPTQPVTFARCDAPPLFIAAGTGDAHVPHENTLSLAHAMTAAGGRCDMALYPDATHLDLVLALSRSGLRRAPVMQDCLTFAAKLGLEAAAEPGDAGLAVRPLPAA